jgi:hypothetical protein
MDASLKRWEIVKALKSIWKKKAADCLGYETLWLGGWNTLEARSQWMSEQSLPRL